MFPSFDGLGDGDDNDDNNKDYSSNDIASRRGISRDVRVQIASTSSSTHVISVFAGGTR